MPQQRSELGWAVQQCSVSSVTLQPLGWRLLSWVAPTSLTPVPWQVSGWTVQGQ